MDRVFLNRWRRVHRSPPNRHNLTDKNIADYLTYCFEYTAKGRHLPKAEFSKATLDQAKTHVSQWLGENNMPRFIQCHRDRYTLAWKALLGMKRSDPYRNWRTGGGQSLEPKEARMLLLGSVYTPATHVPSRVLVRNKAIAIGFLHFGAHKIDLHRMKDNHVIYHNDTYENGYRRPLIEFNGHHTKRHEESVFNVLCCGCKLDHDATNLTTCPVAVLHKYAEMKAEDDGIFFNSRGPHSLYKMRSPRAQSKHINQDDQVITAGFWRKLIPDGSRFAHGGMGAKAIGLIFNEWGQYCGLERRITSAWARKTTVTLGTKLLKLPYKDIKDQTHHMSERNFLKYVMTLASHNPQDYVTYSRTLSNWVNHRFSAPTLMSNAEILQLVLDEVKKINVN
jgi:hypothetical protein